MPPARSWRVAQHDRRAATPESGTRLAGGSARRADCFWYSPGQSRQSAVASVPPTAGRPYWRCNAHDLATETSACFAGLLLALAWGASFNLAADSQPDYLSFSTNDEANTTEVFQRASPAVVFVTSSELRRQRFTRNITEIPRGAAPDLFGTRQRVWSSLTITWLQALIVAITLADETSFQAEMVGLAHERDLAVLRMIDPPAGLANCRLRFFRALRRPQGHGDWQSVRPRHHPDGGG